MSEPKAIVLSELGKVYPMHRSNGTARNRPALQNLNLSVERGELMALLGPSGCGKTTTLRLIAGLESPTEGEIRLEGTLVASGSAWTPPERRSIGLVFQEFALFPHLNVSKNVGFPLRAMARRERQQRVEEMLELVGLSEVGGRYPHELSGGQQQRVALARALASAPTVLLMDEPFSNLDAERREELREQVRSIVKKLGTTALFVTHDQEEALYMGDRVAVMNEGRLEQVGTPEEIFHAPANRFVAQFLGLSTFIPAVAGRHCLVTEFGIQCQAHDGLLGSAVEMLVRPDDLGLRPDPEGNAEIVSVVFRGMDYLYGVRLPSGRTVQCLSSHTERLAIGARVYVELRPGHELNCFVTQEALSPRLNENAIIQQ